MGALVEACSRSRWLFVSASFLCSLLFLMEVSTATAGSPCCSRNLVLNGGGEIGPAAADDVHNVAPADWKTTGDFTAVQYGASGGFPTSSVAGAINGGKQFFAGGTDAAVSTATQVVTIQPSWAKSGLKAALSADLGGFSSQTDDAWVSAKFLSVTGASLGALTVGPVGPGARKNATTLVPVSKTAPLPAATASVEIVITSMRADGSYDDGYVDNVSLLLNKGPQATGASSTKTKTATKTASKPSMPVYGPPPPRPALLCTITGTPGNDTITSDALFPTVICGLSGDDVIHGGPGGGTIVAGSGNDTIYVGAQSTVVYAGTGNETIYACNGVADVIHGGPGIDVAYIDRGKDTVTKVDIVRYCAGGTGT